MDAKKREEEEGRVTQLLVVPVLVVLLQVVEMDEIPAVRKSGVRREMRMGRARGWET